MIAKLINYGRDLFGFKRGELGVDNWTDVGTNRVAGVSVNEKNVLGLSAVYACTRVISETYASLPIFLYEKKGKNKEKAIKHPIYSLLHDKPNDYMTPFIFKQTLLNNWCIYGNSYAVIEFDKMWRPKALHPLESKNTYVDKDPLTGKKIYKTIRNNKLLEFSKEEVIHVPAFGFDGIQGYSPIKLMMNTYGTAVATQKFGNRFFSNGARCSNVLEHPGTISENARINLRASFDAMYSGVENSHKTMLLEEGMKLSPMSVPPDEAQFIETRKLSDIEISRMFKVPPHLIGILDNATFSNIEHQSIQFATNTMLPICKAHEEEFLSKLLISTEKQSMTIETNMDGIIRGDMKSRYEAYSIGKQQGFLNTNDIRALENMNESEGGDIYLMQLNAIPAHLAEEYWKAKIMEGGDKGGKEI